MNVLGTKFRFKGTECNILKCEGMKYFEFSKIWQSCK